MSASLIGRSGSSAFRRSNHCGVDVARGLVLLYGASPLGGLINSPPCCEGNLHSSAPSRRRSRRPHFLTARRVRGVSNQHVSPNVDALSNRSRIPTRRRSRQRRILIQLCRMVEATRDARLSIPLTQHSNQVSTNTNLCPWETRFWAAETKAPKGPLKSNRQIAATKRVQESPANSGLFALNREISVCVRLRGGAGRPRTSNQTVIAETRVNQGSPH